MLLLLSITCFITAKSSSARHFTFWSLLGPWFCLLLLVPLTPSLWKCTMRPGAATTHFLLSASFSIFLWYDFQLVILFSLVHLNCSFSSAFAEVKFRHLPVKHDPFEDTHDPKCPTFKIDDSHLESALKQGHQARDKVRILENELDLTQHVVNTSQISSTARHVIPSISKEQVRSSHHEQLAFEEASKVLAKNFSLSLDNIRDLGHIHGQHLKGHRSKRQTCKPPIFCNRSRFRTPDGSCNNLNNVRWGKSFECVIRLLDPAYSDGISRPRLAKSGNALPNPRMLSATIHQQEDVNGNFTHMLMQWGQFLDHDISLSPVTQLRTGGIKCCPRASHPDCFAIEIPSNDPIFGKENKRCLNFVRSVACQTCRFGPRLQLNELTSFIDASNIYGNTQDEMRNLRRFNSG